LQRLYLDSTVPSAYIDERAPERQRLTVQFWQDRLPSYEPVISVLVLAEIRGTRDEQMRRHLETLIETLPLLPATLEAEALADQYVARGAIPERYRDDALHVAIAVSHQIGLLASWNFRHLVKVQVRREINLINAIMGYGSIEIVSPPEL